MSKVIGVIVGRFQVPFLHDGHRHLIESAMSACDSVLVVLGVHGGLSTHVDPLEYDVRKKMITAQYPSIQIAPIYDQPSDMLWSQNLDCIIEKHRSEQSVMLFGSRDSFIASYSGMHQTSCIEQLSMYSGTAIRDNIDAHVRDDQSFRAGQIAYQQSRLAVAYPVVDIAVVRESDGKVLLGQKKKDGEKMRFIGGFVDPSDESLEKSAHRELIEEVGHIEVARPQYVGSRLIADHRYRNARDGVMSSFFCASYIFGAPRAKDDLDAVAWIDSSELKYVLVPEHRYLGEMFLTFCKKQNITV